MKQKKSIAIFMITLILTLPIYSAMVLGDFKVTSIFGNDGVQGFRKVDDTTTIRLISDIADVRIGANKLDACSGANGTFTCIFTESGIVEAQSVNYPFYRYVSGSLHGSPARGSTIYIDNSAPSFSTFNIDYVNKNITATMDVSDSGFNSANSGGCSGVKMITFYDNSNPAGTYNGTLPNSTCTSTPITFIYPKPSEDGVHIYRADAIDYLGNTNSSVITTLYLDITPPSVEEAHLTIGGVPLEYISTLTLSNVKVNVTIKDYNISLTNSISADLSNLNKKLSASSYKDVKFTCTFKEESTYNCISAPIELNLPNGSANIVINTLDLEGNTGNQTMTISLTPDKTPPEVSLSTSNCDESEEKQCYITKNKNVIFVSLKKQTGAGYASKFIYLSSPTIGIPPITPVNRCIKNSDEWLCSMNLTISNPLIEGQTQLISLVYPSQDDIKNYITISNLTTLKVKYDSKKPELFQNITFQRNGGVNYLQTGDRLEVKMWVFENTSGIKLATANFDKAIPKYGWEETTCTLDSTKGENIYLCNWVPDTPVKSNITLNATIFFNVTDYAGNTNYFKDSFTIYGRGNATTDPFWTADVVNVDPPFIDTVTTQYVPGTEVWADVKFTPKDKNAKLIDIGLKTCTPSGGIDYLSNTVFLPPAATDTNPYASIGLKISQDNPLPTYNDSLTYVCTLTLTTLLNNKVYPPQESNVTITFGVKNFGVDLPKEYKDKISNFKKELKDKAWIDSLNKFFEWGRKICTIGKNIYEMWSGASPVLNGVCKTLEGVVYTYAIGLGICKTESVTTASIDKGFYEYFLWICSVMDCSLLDRMLTKGKVSSDSKEGVNFLAAYIKTMDIYIATLSASTSALNPLAAGGGSASSVKDPPNLGSNAWEASKKSIIVSGLLMCVPGIIYNIEKARQIDCMYVSCAEKMTSVGLNPFDCEVMRANSYCNFVYGSLFHAIPFSGLMDLVGNFVKLFASNPVTAAYMGASYACSLADADTGPYKGICRGVKTFTTISNLIGSVEGMFKMITSSNKPRDYCSEIGIGK